MRSYRLVGIVVVAVTVALGVVTAQDEPGFKPLFNGKDLAGWVPYLGEKGGDPAKTFMVKDGVIITSGKPNGYIRTEKPYENYILKLEWRYARPADLKSDAEFRGNSGVLVHLDGADRIWPRSIEVQLQNLGAGSIFPVGGTGAKTDNRTTVKGKAKPVGEWNTYEIRSKDGVIEVLMNGESVGKITGSEPRRGTIALQSEGAEIHFRNIRIQELK
jgi:hypothetical protein